jgi:hypothetical protein
MALEKEDMVDILAIMIFSADHTEVLIVKSGYIS